MKALNEIIKRESNNNYSKTRREKIMQREGCPISFVEGMKTNNQFDTSKLNLLARNKEDEE